MTENIAKRKPTMKNIFSYAVGDLYGGGAFFIIGALFMVFLTDVVHLSPALAGVIVFVGKTWDAISDPTMGYISDNTRSKYGRRRIYFLIGIFPIFLSWILLWSNFGLSTDVGKFIYFLLIYILFNTVFTLVMVPYNTMPAEMTSEFKDRTKLMTIRMLFSQTGMLLGAVLPTAIIASQASPTTGHLIMATVFGIIFAVPWIFVFKGTYETYVPQGEKVKLPAKEVAKKIAKDFSSTTRNKSLRIQTAMYIAAYVSMDIFMAMLVYYIRYYITMQNGWAYGSTYTILLGVVVVTQMLSLLVAMKLVNKFGNAMTYRIHAAVWMVAVLGLFLITPDLPLPVLIGVCLITGFGLSGCVLTPYNMLAFTIDADEMITKKRREGTYAGMLTFIRKIAQALALLLVGVFLDLVGYQEPVTEGVYIMQTPQTLAGIKWLIFVAPIILLTLGIISSFRYKINPVNHKILIDEIERLRNGGNKEDVNNQTLEVVESITGLPYKDLWPDKVE